MVWIKPTKRASTAKRNQYLSAWKQDHVEATDKIVVIDEALETRTISPERYKARVMGSAASQA